MKKNINNTNESINEINKKISLPCGKLCGDNCSDCLYANWSTKDKNGYIRCQNSNIGGWVLPEKREGCWHYKWEKA